MDETFNNTNIKKRKADIEAYDPENPPQEHEGDSYNPEACMNLNGTPKRPSPSSYDEELRLSSGQALRQQARTQEGQPSRLNLMKVVSEDQEPFSEDQALQESAPGEAQEPPKYRNIWVREDMKVVLKADLERHNDMLRSECERADSAKAKIGGWIFESMYLRGEVVALRKDNASIHRELADVRVENATLREDNASIHKKLDTVLTENGKLKEMFEKFIENKKND